MRDSIGIADLAAILTAAGTTIYVLGLIGLAIPISRVFTGDISTAWYAVSLVPKTFVAGQGVRIWLRWPVVLTALLWFATALAPITSVTTSHKLFQGIMLGAFLFELWWTASRFVGQQRAAASWLYGFMVGFIQGGGILMIAVSFSYLTAAPAPVEIPFLPSNGNFMLGILLLFVGSFLFGLQPAILATLPLPEIRIAKKPDEGEKGRAPLNGRLVAHSDGFWHLFDENNDLLSIPDDQVLSVRIVSKTDTHHTKKSRLERLLRFLWVEARNVLFRSRRRLRSRRRQREGHPDLPGDDRIVRPPRRDSSR